MNDPENDGPQSAEDVDAIPQQMLADDFHQQYLVVCECDLQALSLERRRTTEYFELGRCAARLQDQLGYGNWGNFLQEHGYVERTISRALRIFRNLKDHPEFANGLTLAEAEEYGAKLAKAADDEAKHLAESVERSTNAARNRVSKKANAERAELRKNALEALASGNDLEQELRSILPKRHAEELDGAAPADEQLLLESDAASAKTLKGIYEELHPEGLPQHGEDPCENCNYLWDVLAETVAGEGIDITDDERTAFDGFVALVGDDDRALRVFLALAHDLLC